MIVDAVEDVSQIGQWVETVQLCGFNDCHRTSIRQAVPMARLRSSRGCDREAPAVLTGKDHAAADGLHQSVLADFPASLEMRLTILDQLLREGYPIPAVPPRISSGYDPEVLARLIPGLAA